jgi:hypothetical protein
MQILVLCQHPKALIPAVAGEADNHRGQANRQGKAAGQFDVGSE